MECFSVAVYRKLAVFLDESDVGEDAVAVRTGDGEVFVDAVVSEHVLAFAGERQMFPVEREYMLALSDDRLYCKQTKTITNRLKYVFRNYYVPPAAPTNWGSSCNRNS